MLKFEAGDRLRGAAELIAQGTLARDYRRRPALLERYGDAGRAKYRQDVLYNVDALSAAVDADDVGGFLRYVAWLKILLVSRAVAADDVAESLHCMEWALKENAADDYALASSYVHAAMELFDSMPTAVASFLEPSCEAHAVAHRCLDALLRLDASAARETLETALGAGMPLARIYTAILPPLMREVGRLWQMNEISVAHEHFCSSAMQSIMGGFYQRLFAGTVSPPGRSMLVVCVEGEQHELGARTVADVFQLSGWRTSFLGANLPSRELLTMLRDARKPPDLVALSATMPAHLARMASTIEAIRDNSGIPIMVGGYLFQGTPNLAQRMGAEGCADDAEAALAIADKLVARAA